MGLAIRTNIIAKLRLMIGGKSFFISIYKERKSEEIESESKKTIDFFNKFQRENKN
ncbi:hypothetical protein [Listeria marthii]|uniref:hypothetical protein n=1 Tax=Listeria marthii TaxID=529731 RepID=UPI001888C16F|nr:hypothetical protein [Listeria marthii]MBF2516643.1 hypothetical protein [Listeria marthii]